MVEGGVDTFVWTPVFETGLEEVDEQHRRLVQIINELGEALSSQRPVAASELETLHEALREYALLHFTDEEELMDKERVSAAHRERHRGEHEFFVAELDRLSRKTPDENDEQRREQVEDALRFLSSWLAYHILGVDRFMARQVARIRQGASAEDALARELEALAESATTEPLLAALHALFHHVAERNASLRELNETLEQRVAERTAELERANHRLEVLAMSDALSGLPNRRHAMLQLELAWEAALESGGPMTVIMADADGFKSVNDTYGHEAGDAVIVALGKTLRNAVRTDDVVCRMGGDEFLILCPRTDLEGGRQVADNVWRAVGALRVPLADEAWQGSMSLGVAARRPEMRSVAELIKAADEAVYRAKAAGRNRVVAAD